MANIVALGLIVGVTGVVPEDAVIAAILDRVPKGPRNLTRRPLLQDLRLPGHFSPRQALYTIKSDTKGGLWNMIKEAREKWEQGALAKVLNRFPERQEDFSTDSGISVERICTPEDLKDWDYLGKLGFPGQHPFTRGVQPTMYRGWLWTMRQYAGFGTAQETNERFRFLLDQGQTGLSVAFDLPTQIGYDSDHDLAEGEVGVLALPSIRSKTWKWFLTEFPLARFLHL